MGHSNTASWIKCLEKMQKFDVKFVLPGHGKIAPKDLIAKQKQYFADMREQIQKGIDAKKDLEDIRAGLNMPSASSSSPNSPSACRGSRRASP